MLVQSVRACMQSVLVTLVLLVVVVCRVECGDTACLVSDLCCLPSPVLSIHKQLPVP